MGKLSLALIFVFLLTACAPAQVATPAPAATPTPVPTITPTPIPTLPPQQAGGLSGIPNPRATAPELFDLRSPDAPIPQFVNAMKMASARCSERFGGRIRL